MCRQEAGNRELVSPAERPKPEARTEKHPTVSEETPWFSWSQGSPIQKRTGWGTECCSGAGPMAWLSLGLMHLIIRGSWVPAEAACSTGLDWDLVSQVTKSKGAFKKLGDEKNDDFFSA